MKTFLPPSLMLVSILFALGCRNTTTGFDKKKLTELTMFASTDTFRTDSGNRLSRSRYFIYDEAKSQKLKDSFFIEFVNTLDITGLEQAHFSFFGKSEKTNVEYLKLHPRDLDRYSQKNDLRFEYVWAKWQKGWKIYRFEDGKLS